MRQREMSDAVSGAAQLAPKQRFTFAHGVDIERWQGFRGMKDMIGPGPQTCPTGLQEFAAGP
jgi:hypothetical protein